MIAQVVRYILPAAFSVIPTGLRSREAASLLTAIGLQESRFLYRHQMRGPAHGFWQFELAGVRGVQQHAHAGEVLRRALLFLCYEPTITAELLHDALVHNDVLAAVMARCLLLTDPEPLPGPEDVDTGWRIYLSTWRPGRPRACTWPRLYGEAWTAVVNAPGPQAGTPINA